MRVYHTGRGSAGSVSGRQRSGKNKVELDDVILSLIKNEENQNTV